MKHPLAYISAVLVLLSLVAFLKWHEYAKENKLRELAAWSALGDHDPVLGRYSYTSALLTKLYRVQLDSAIDKKYRITDADEKEYLEEIIEAYQIETMRSYFQGRLSLIKSKYAVGREDFFMFSLYNFLGVHSDDREFLGRSLKSGPGRTYSKFAIVYAKAHYICYVYCKNSKVANPSALPQWMNWVEKNIKEVLDTVNIPE